MLFEQSGSLWLWWVCISWLESEGGRGGWAFCKKYSALFTRGWLVSARPFPRHCVVWCLQIFMLGHTLTEQRSKENAKLTDSFFWRAGKTEPSKRRGHSDFNNLASPPRQPPADGWSFSVSGFHSTLSGIWKCLDQPRRSAATLGTSQVRIRTANLHAVWH